MMYSTRSWQRRSEQTQPHTPVITPQRAWLLGAVFAVAFVGVTARLVYWQVAQHGELTQLAQSQHQQTQLIPSGRGTIFDRNGTILALTVSGDAVVLDPQVTQQAESKTPGYMARMARTLSDITQIPVDAITSQLNLPTAYHILTGADAQPVRLEIAASDTINAAIAKGVLPGVALEAQSWRADPGGSLGSQILGFVTPAGVGQYGVEQAMNAQLAGTPGKRIGAADAQGNPLANGPQLTLPANPGADVTLTLDANLQAIAEAGLKQQVAATGASGGTVIIMDPQTGAILALANAPDFDPNAYGQAPLANLADPAIAAAYDPGSTMKTITMAAGVDTRTITPDTTFTDSGSVTVGGQTIYNWNHLAWGTESMTQVLQHSANVGAVWVAQQLGQPTFDRYLDQFGFGTATGVDLPGEAKGLLPPQETDPNLAALDLAENSFGESIGVTPLQMITAYAALANGGKLMRPYVVQSVTRDGHTTTTQPVMVRQAVSAQTAATATQMLVDSSLHSEAQTALIPSYAIAAKTGTSTPDPQHPEQTYASMIGYAPADQPRFVVLVKLDKPQTNIFGGAAAGPLWRALVRQLLAYDQVSAQGGA